MEKENDKTAWGEWLQALLADRLSGTGLRPEVEYIPAGDEDPGSNPGRYRVRIVCPLEWRVTDWVKAGEHSQEQALAIADAVLEFWREAWPEGICSDYMYGIFCRVPGYFEWKTEQAPVILYRVTMQQLTQRFGSRSVRGITMYEDLLVVHTRWAGDFYIGIDNYRERLEEVAHAMHAFMRKPIRYPFLYKLRHGKDTEK